MGFHTKESKGVETVKFFDKVHGTINPKSYIMRVWDVFTSQLLLIVAVITPYEVAFLGGEIDALFYFNSIMNLFFFIDVCFNFYLPFINPNTGSLVYDIKLIRQRYLRSWFAIDFVSIIPFDMYVVMPNSDDYHFWKSFRLVRVLRLTKMLRMLRGMRVFSRWEARLNINYALMSLLSTIAVLLTFAHWLACGWGLVLRYNRDPYTPELEEMADTFDDDWKTVFRNYILYVDADSSAFTKYIACLYWAVGMIMANSITPPLSSDTLVATYVIAMILCGVMNAYLIGGVVNLMDRFTERSTKFYRTMDSLNSFLKERNVMDDDVVEIDELDSMTGSDLCEKLRSYYIFKFKAGTVAQCWQEDILNTCSTYMQSAVAYKMNANTLMQIPFFKRPSD
eukprot:gene17571-20923_t